MGKKTIVEETQTEENKERDDLTPPPSSIAVAGANLPSSFADSSVVPKESPEIAVSKEGHHALMLAVQGQGEVESEDLLLSAAKIIEAYNQTAIESEKLKLVLLDAGYADDRSVIEAARDYIVRANSELQVLDTVLIANFIKEPDSNIHPIEAAVKFISNLPKETTAAKIEGRQLVAGTKLMLGGETVVLSQNASVTYPDETNEMKFVGLCVNSDNLETNRQNIRFRCNGLGGILPIQEQVDNPSELPEFIGNLTEAEANMFNVPISQWEEYRNKE
jgi:hypothetical protein